MPLPTPILDDRSYQQLRDELVRRIPVYNPEWTDHNPSDPGITLIELFAFLGENLLYRFNQIPETTKLAFLRLLDVPLRPAAAARAMLVINRKTGVVGAPTTVRLGTTAKAGNVPFEITTEVTVAPWRSIAVAKATATTPDTAEAKDFAAAAVDAMGGLAPGEQPAYYQNSLVPDDPSRPDALPVDFAATVDGMIWVAALGKTTGPDVLAGKTINIGFIPEETIQSIADASDPCPGDPTVQPRTSPCTPAEASGGAPGEVIWEISTGQLDPSKQPIYKTLAVQGDTTAGMRRAGVVRLRIPQDTANIGVFSTVDDPDRLGTGMLPPTLANAAENADVVFWLRAYHRSEDRRFGRALWIGLNAAESVQKKRAATEFLGTGTGQAAQRCALVNRPVIAGSMVLEVEDQPGVWARWTEVDGFDASREDDKHYVLDLEAGQVQFGNGVQGFAPQIGQRIRATEYRYGGGPAGNVPAKAVSALEAASGDTTPLGSLVVTNPLPARGGAPSEAIAAALERLPGELRRHDRAVTASDFREIAMATPGAEVGRAEVIPRFDPRSISTQVAGAVSVVVWPREDRKHPNAPMPDRTTLSAVCAWLDRRRLITTELHVIPPTYVKVAVSIGVHVKPGYGVDTVRSWVELVVRQYLAPLPPYGPEGKGWPLGRRVYAPELEAAALQVEGVEYIDEQGVKVAHLVDGAWVSEPVNLLPHQVPELDVITVVSGAPLDPGKEFAPPPAVAGKKLVPIPTIPEEC
jgi:baseplate J-like protein